MQLTKIHLPVLILLLIGPSVRSEDVQEARFPTTARVLGVLADGTPPAPAPSKPQYVAAASDILQTQTHRQGGRDITVQKIKPIALPPPQEAAPLIDLSDPAVLQRIAAFRAKRTKQVFLLVGATVYHSDDSPPRSLVQIWPQAEGGPVTVWSSADFALLSGFSNFAGSSGETTSLMMMWSVTNLRRNNALQQKFARQFKAPDMPEFSPGKATFTIISGNPTAATLSSIQSLHDLYNNEYIKLKAAYEGRERAQVRDSAEQKANPPKPKDIVLNHWDIGEDLFTAPAPSKGEAR